MTCPFCDFEGHPRQVHAHLTEAHLEQVTVEVRGRRRFYRIACPDCEEAYEREIKPRLDDPSFVEEFRREIALVGFDMLINHLVAEHGRL